MQPGVDERLERDREPLAGLQVQRSRLHGAPELQREERVPARELVDLEEHRAGRDPAEPALQDALDGADAERAEHEVVEAIARERAIEVERGGRRARGPLRDQQGDRLIGQSPHGEAEHRRARPVEPLHVVDRHHERRRAGERAQRRQRGERDGLLVGLVVVLRHAEGDLERAALRAGELVEHRRVGAQEVAERGVGEARLRLGGPGGDGSHARHPRTVHRRLPQRRLPHARLARDQQRPHARRHGLHEALHASQLIVSTAELGLHGDGGRAYSRRPTPRQGLERSATHSPLRTPLMAGRAGL